MRTPYKLFFQTAARVLTSFERRHRKRMACRVSALILGFTVAGSITLAGGEDQSPSVLTIYNFNSLKKGADIYGGLIIGPGGVLYGTAEQGGLLTAPCPISTDGCGNVFQLTPPSAPGSGWEETVLHRFGSTANDGYYPAAALTMGPNGVLYGTTAYGGGSSSVGTVFQLTPPVSPDGAWTETIIHAFNASGDGSYPASTLALGTDGILYGTTTGGGTSNYGTVFSLVPPPTPGGTWTESVLHSFTGPPGDGAAPAGGVLVGPGGVLFGATSIGGSLYNGTVYQLTPPASGGDSWAIKLLHSFSATNGDGFSPEAGVTISGGGVLYGPTDKGGTADYGSIYQLTPSVSPGGPWKESVIYSFTGAGGDANPWSKLVLGKGGELYGTTLGGTAFKLQPPASPGEPWTEVFALGLGAPGYGGLVRDESGVLYGTATGNLAGQAFEF